MTDSVRLRTGANSRPRGGRATSVRREGPTDSGRARPYHDKREAALVFEAWWRRAAADETFPVSG